MAKTVKEAYGEILRLRNEFYQKWQENDEPSGHNRTVLKAKYEAFDKALELMTPSIVDPQSEEPVNEELEKVAYEYSLYPVAPSKFVLAEQGFKDGANWQKQQLMKKAIEGIVTTNIDGWINVMTGFIRPEEAGANFGDKVKLIIIKER